MLFSTKLKNKRQSINNLFLILVLLFSSCLTIETEMKLNSNGSGEITMKYILDQGLKDISSLGSEDDIVPLNLSKDYITEVTASRNDITFRDYTIIEDETFYTVSVTFEFDSIDALNSVLPADNAFSITTSGNETILSQTVVPETEEALNPETLGIFEDIFEENTVTFKITTPKEVVQVENCSKIGTKTAYYQESLIELINTTDRRYWSIRW